MPAFKPMLAGEVYGRLTVVRDRERGERVVLCVCECGTKKWVSVRGIRYDDTISCGCLIKEKITETLFRPAPVGAVFGRLTVIKDREHGDETVLCQCACGQEKLANAKALFIGAVQSCGCLHREGLQQRNHNNATHGLSGTLAYRSWSDMLRRCYSPSTDYYHCYGGRGIAVCDRWRISFENFFEDMGEPASGLTIDRIDTNGDYEKSNCHWATRSQQALNRRPSAEWKPSSYRGTQCINAKLTEDDVRFIREHYAAGRATQQELGERFGVSQTSIGKVIRRVNWKHVT